MLRFDDLGFAYRPGEWVLRHCSGAVEPGSVLAILGPNGRGKSTLLKLLLGVISPQEGRVRAEDHVALVPQLFDVAFDYDVLTMVLMGRARRLGLLRQPGRADVAAALATLDRLGIADLARRPFQRLSGGQRQLAMIARAMVAEADVLLLDEPTASLDLRNQAVVLGWIRTLAREHGLAVAFTTHQPDHALAVADEAMLMMAPGRVIGGPADATLTAANLTGLYDHPVARGVLSVGDRLVEVVAPVLAAEADGRRSASARPLE